MQSVRERGFSNYTKIDDALRIFLEAFPEGSLSTERVSLDAALGRVLATDLIAPYALPRSNKAAMDGYALRAEDTFGASSTNSILLKLVGKIGVGDRPHLSIARGEACSVATGALMPEGADAVLMLEYARLQGEGVLEVLKAVAPGENVAKVGEDVKEGQLLLKRGTRLKPQDIGIAAAFGLKELEVFKKPLVGVLSTGNEVIRQGEELVEGKVYDVNGPVIRAMIKEGGGEPLDLGIVPDERAAIRERLKEGLERCDLLLVSGGTSVGEKDLVPESVRELGGEIMVHGVAMRPGSPVALARAQGRPLVLLSGYPVAAMMAFRVFVMPLLARLQATKLEPEPIIKARMGKRIVSHGGMRTFARVALRKEEGGWVANPIRTSGAGVISSMTLADGLLIVPEEKEGIEEGEEVEVILFRPLPGG